jgi:hypothetical protein
MSMVSACIDEIDILGKSAAFAMSLGAKELFHTNFLAFLLESDDPSLEPIQLAIRRALNFSPGPGALARCAVWREKNNLDLIVVELRSAPAEAAETTARVGDEQDTSRQKDKEALSWDWDPDTGWSASGRMPPENANAAGVENLMRDMPGERVLIIEAKLKSLPRQQQLRDYDIRLAKSGILLAYPEDAAKPEWSIRIGRKSRLEIERRLLSVSGVSMQTDAVPAPAGVEVELEPALAWQGISWHDLYSAMSAETASLAGSPMQQVLTDYVQMLGALVRVLDRVHLMCRHAHDADGGSPTYGALRKQVLAPAWRSLRIHDLLGKTLFDYWLTHWVGKAAAPALPDGWSLNRYVNYSRGVPGIGVELVNHEFNTPNDGAIPLRIGVQIQNCEFRLFIDANKGWNRLESWIASSEPLMRDWFGVEVFGKTPIGVGGLPIKLPEVGDRRKKYAGRATNLKVFDVNRFLYSKVDIDDQAITRVEQEIERLMVIAATLVVGL